MTFKWCKFQAYFALWAFMILNCISGGSVLVSGFRNIELNGGYDFVLLIAGGLRIFMAILSACAAVQLIRFERSGVKKLRTLYICIIIVRVISLFSDLSAPNIIGLIVSVIMLFVNKVYYNNRSEYFH